MKRTIVLGFASLTLAACGSQVTDPSLVSGPRILAVKAEPPEAAPGATVSLSALLVGTSGAVTRTWSVCNPDPTLGISSCDDPSRRTQVIGEGNSVVFTIPANALDNAPPAAKLSGIDLYLALEATAESGPAFVRPLAVRSVKVSQSPTPNANPSLASLTVGGSADYVPLFTVSDLALEASAASGSAQSYQTSTGQTFTERLTLDWFVTDGSLDDYTETPDTSTGLATTTWHHTSGRPGEVWAVLYDSRGGVDWRTW